MSSSGRAVLALSVAMLAASVGGCGETVIDDAKTEDAIEQNLEESIGKRISAVDCPSGIEVEKGKTFDCTVTLRGGGEETAVMKILNDDADIELSRLQPAK